MPTYFFDIHQKDGAVTDDTIGTVFDNHAQARQEAERALGEMAHDALLEPGTTQIRISVRNEQGQVIATRSARFEAEDFDVELHPTPHSP